MNATAKLTPGTRVNYVGSDKFGTIVEGIAPFPSQVLVQLDDFADLGATHALFREDLEVV